MFFGLFSLSQTTFFKVYGVSMGFLWKLKSPYIGLVRDERKGFNRFSVFPIVRTQGIRSYWTELLSRAELLNWAENVIFDILEPLLFENIVHVLYYLNFVFVFVSVFVFVVLFVVSGWTPVLSSFRRCMKCWLECWNRRNTDVLLTIGLMAPFGSDKNALLWFGHQWMPGNDFLGCRSVQITVKHTLLVGHDTLVLKLPLLVQCSSATFYSVSISEPIPIRFGKKSYKIL